MSNSSDTELVGRFVHDGSETAFAELVDRYAPLVHSVALRLTGTSDLARDVTQLVFIDLLKKTVPLTKKNLATGREDHKVTRR